MISFLFSGIDSVDFTFVLGQMSKIFAVGIHLRLIALKIWPVGTHLRLDLGDVFLLGAAEWNVGASLGWENLCPILIHFLGFWFMAFGSTGLFVLVDCAFASEFPFGRYFKAPTSWLFTQLLLDASQFLLVCWELLGFGLLLLAVFYSTVEGITRGFEPRIPSFWSNAFCLAFSRS